MVSSRRVRPKLFRAATHRKEIDMGVREMEIWDMVGSYPSCPKCKGTQVLRDAWAKWNGDRREWELATVFDNMVCDDCGEITPNWALDETFRGKRVRRLNDAARRGTGHNVSIVVTAGVQNLGEDSVKAALQAISDFTSFTESNDPHAEHDFGAVEVDGETLFWKIDYFDLQLKWHSPDKANPDVTQRVLTIMLASEY